MPLKPLKNTNRAVNKFYNLVASYYPKKENPFRKGDQRRSYYFYWAEKDGVWVKKIVKGEPPEISNRTRSYLNIFRNAWEYTQADMAIVIPKAENVFYVPLECMGYYKDEVNPVRMTRLGTPIEHFIKDKKNIAYIASANPVQKPRPYMSVIPDYEVFAIKLRELGIVNFKLDPIYGKFGQLLFDIQEYKFGGIREYSKRSGSEDFAESIFDAISKGTYKAPTLTFTDPADAAMFMFHLNDRVFNFDKIKRYRSENRHGLIK